MDCIRQCVTDLAKRHNISEAIAANWTERIAGCYNELHRQYHTLEHIESMSNCLARRGEIVELEDGQAVETAIIFHDIVYDPVAKDNEIQSIEEFKIFATDFGLPKFFYEKVCRLITRTIRHELEAGDDLDTRAFLDSDLEVLSRDTEQYQRYAQQIRAEYNYYSENVYCEGRIKVLTSFLQRSQIYFSEGFADLEPKARSNIESEIRELKQKLMARHEEPSKTENL